MRFCLDAGVQPSLLKRVTHDRSDPGRLGYAVGQLMPYVTGGYAFADLRRGFGMAFGDAMANGWTLGGGIEALLAPN
jgi:hypothetical protein